MSREFMCPECGSQVISNHNRQKFCSNKCQKNFNARKIYNKVRSSCVNCGESLENSKYCRRFCSEACRLETRNVRRAQRAYLKKKHLVDQLGGKCSRCGYCKTIRALQFHHTTPEEKDFVIGENLIYKSLSVLEDEAKKCILLCANCHFEEHDNWAKYQQC